MTRVACLMMQKDERLLLLPWLLYHGYLFGYENLFVYDNGSAAGPVQEILAQFEALGVNVDREHNDLADFAAKGDRLGRLASQFRDEDRYDTALFLDCDEFLAIETETGFSCARGVIMAELDRLAAAGAFGRIDRCLLNAPGHFDLFNHAWHEKWVVPLRHFTSIDHGFHQPARPPGQDFAPTSLLHIHLRCKPFHQMQAHALLKLSAFTDVTDPAALHAYEGTGRDLVPAVLAREAGYYRVTDALGPLVTFAGLADFLRQFAGFETRRRIWESGRPASLPNAPAPDAAPPSSAVGLKDMALAAMAEGRPAAAAGLWQDYRALFPDDQDGYDFGMTACRAAGDLAGRDAGLIAGLARFASYVPLGIEEAERAVGQGNFAGAQRLFEAVHAADPVNSELAAAGLRCAPQCGFYNPAISCFDYLGVLDELSTGNLPEITCPHNQNPNKEDLKSQLAQAYEFIDLLDMAAHGALLEQGISTEFLNIVKQGHGAVSNAFMGWAGQNFGAPWTDKKLSAGIGDALAVIKTGAKHALSPWSGGFVATRNSLGPRWYLVKDGGNGFFCGHLQPVAMKAQDCVWVLPGIRKILFIPADSRLNKEVILESFGKMLTRALRRLPDVATYLQTAGRKTVIYERHCPQFGHYVWNVLSAWGQLLELVPPAEIGHIITHRDNMFFGSVTEMFGLTESDIEERHIDSEDEIFDIAFDEHCLVSFIQFDHITAAAAAAVVKNSVRRCEPVFRDRLASLAARCWPVVLFSLRLDNRAWADQVDGFIELAVKTRQAFPNAGFLIHGLSRDVPMGWTTSWMSLEAEIATAEQIEFAIREFAPVLSAVGRTMHESVAVSEYCDVFAAPIGSGMALYKWLTNKPGVAFSNQHCLNPVGQWAYQVFDHCRDDVIVAAKIPLSAITDLETDRHGTIARANFTLDRQALFETLENLLLSLPRRNEVATAAD